MLRRKTTKGDRSLAQQSIVRCFRFSTNCPLKKMVFSQDRTSKNDFFRRDGLRRCDITSFVLSKRQKEISFSTGSLQNRPDSDPSIITGRSTTLHFHHERHFRSAKQHRLHRCRSCGSCRFFLSPASLSSHRQFHLFQISKTLFRRNVFASTRPHVVASISNDLRLYQSPHSTSFGIGSSRNGPFHGDLFLPWRIHRARLRLFCLFSRLLLQLSILSHLSREIRHSLNRPVASVRRGAFNKTYVLSFITTDFVRLDLISSV